MEQNYGIIIVDRNLSSDKLKSDKNKEGLHGGFKMRTYDANFRLEAVKLAGEIGNTKAAKELNVPVGTLDTWVHKAKNGQLRGAGANPRSALTLAEEVKKLKQENRELKRANEILSKAAALFPPHKAKTGLYGDPGSQRAKRSSGEM